MPPDHPSRTPHPPEPGAASAPGSASPFAPAPPAPLVERALPVARELRRYRRNTAQRDLVAGVTVAALAIPSAMAYAELAGVSAVHGLYALLLPAIGYAVLGSSRQLSIGPEASLSALVAAAILPLAAAGSTQAAELAAMLALLIGVCYALALVLRLGWLADYFSRPVLVGYIHGVVVVLLIGQLGKLLGLSIEATDPIPQLAEVAREIGDVNGASLAVAAAALAVLLPARYVAPRFPAALVVVVAGIVASSALDLAAHGVVTVGDIPSGLPSFALPSPSWEDVTTLAPAAVGLFLVGFADEILTARTYSQRHGDLLGVDQELRAMGVANAAAGLTQGFAVGASGSRTAVSDAMGARSQLAGVLSAVVIVVILLFLSGPLADLPKPVLGAAIVAAAVGLVDPSAWRSLAATDRVEVAIAGVTAAGVVLAGVLEAVVFAVGLTIVDAVRRSARPGDAVLGFDPTLGRWADVVENPDARIEPGVVVYRLESRLFFANVRYVKDRVAAAVRGAGTPTRWLVIDCEAVTQVDATGMDALGELHDRLEHDGVTLLLARVRTPLRRSLREGGALATIGPEHVHGTVRSAVAACLSADRPPED